MQTEKTLKNRPFQIKLEAKQIVRERGLERVRLEDIVAEITPKGRATVPDEVKRELLTKVCWRILNSV